MKKSISEKKLNICIVKQENCYDLYTKYSRDPRELLESSNWRTGPIGLWFTFNVDFKIVKKRKEKECNIGKKYWEEYTKELLIDKSHINTEIAEEVNWGKYNIVISIDLAIPKKIVKNYKNVMWCYYFIEGGPKSIDKQFSGSPFFGYNVFFNHRFAKTKLNQNSIEIKSKIKNGRVVLDFPYYIVSKESFSKIYKDYVNSSREKIILNHHGYKMLTKNEELELNKFGEIKKNYKTLSDIHKIEMESKYFIMHPKSQQMAGLALIEAVASGCVVLAPSRLVWGFNEIIEKRYDYNTFDELIQKLEILNNHDEYEKLKKVQSKKVTLWCFENPVYNLSYLYENFKITKIKFMNVKESLDYSVNRMRYYKYKLTNNM